MKLTAHQIQNLYKFTRQHYVVYYDVQTELVDHLANNIENIWQEKPNLSFEEARDISFKKFGVFGFMDVIEEKQKAMNKKYLKILWGFVKEWFQLPKIMITLGSIFILFQLFSSVIGAFSYYISWGIFFVFLLIKSLRLRKITKNRFKETGKKWMLEDMIFMTTSANIPLMLSFLFNVHLYEEYITSQIGAILFSVFFVIVFLVVHITLTVIPEKGEELLAATYPEYKLANSL